MKTHVLFSYVTVVLFPLLAADRAASQLMSSCVENSSERRGELGCSIIETKSLPGNLRDPLYWHIDRFDSAERARSSVGPASVSFDAAGASWLMTIESQTSDHHGGSHVAQVGPLQLPQAAKYSLQVLSSVFPPGMYSLAHHHSGVELCTSSKARHAMRHPPVDSSCGKARPWRFRPVHRCARQPPDQNLVTSWRSSFTTRHNLLLCQWTKEQDQSSSDVGNFDEYTQRGST